MCLRSWEAARPDRQVSGGSAAGPYRLHWGGGGQQAQVHSHSRVRVQHLVAEAAGAAYAGPQVPGPGNAVQRDEGEAVAAPDEGGSCAV